MAGEASRGNPFVGPVPFEREDADLFFGRRGEIAELVSLVVANRVVVLYAASGAGKTSLLNAGVLPLLEQRERFEVLPSARFSRVAADDAEARSAANVYVYTTLLNWSDEPTPASPRHATLAEFLASRPPLRDARERRLPRVVVFDQFEEIFTVHPEHWDHREGFFQQLGAALDADRHLHLVLTLREDYLAQLEPLLPLLLSPAAEGAGDAELLAPAARPHVRFRLERLGREGAIEAVTGPVLGAGRAFAEGVAEGLVADLQKLRVDVGLADPVDAPGEFVEPVQLQVVCHSLWQELPADVRVITAEHVQAFGDVDEVLERFYAEAVVAAAKKARVGEPRLRKWVEESFITSLGTRNMIYRSVDSKARFPDAAIDELENRHLIRGEWRAGTRWYELTHDRFIRPIQRSNERVAEELSRRRLKRARVFAAVLAPIVVAGAIWGASTRGDSGEKLALLAARGTLELNVPYDAFLQRFGGPPRPDRNEHGRLGNVVPVIVTLTGYEGSRVVLRGATVDDAGGGDARATTSVTLTAAADEEQRSTDVWFPLPQRAGRFRHSVELFEEGDGEALARVETRFFRVRGEGMTFVAAPDVPVVALSVQITGDGRGRVVSFPTGIDCPVVCSSQYETGVGVTLVATAAQGFVFTGWRGGCRGVRTCSLTVGRATTVEATFAVPPGSRFDFVRAGTPAGLGLRRSPRYDDRVGVNLPNGRRVRIFCYTKGEPVGQRHDPNWAKVGVDPDRWVPATFLRYGRAGRPRGVRTCAAPVN